MALFGVKKRRTRELANEILAPVRQDLSKLTEVSRINFEADIRRVVDMGQEQELYNRQNGWKRDEEYDDKSRWLGRKS